MDKYQKKEVFQEMKKCVLSPVYIELDQSREELEVEYIRDKDSCTFIVNLYDEDRYHSVWSNKYYIPVMKNMLNVFTEKTSHLETCYLYVDYDYQNKNFRLGK